MQNHSSTMQLTSPIFSENLMPSRLGELGLQSIDVGGAGDCLLRPVSHQLYGNSNHHMCIHTAWVQFMRDNPERFIESNTENSWLRYLNNVYSRCTWFIQTWALSFQVLFKDFSRTNHIFPRTCFPLNWTVCLYFSLFECDFGPLLPVLKTSVVQSQHWHNVFRLSALNALIQPLYWGSRSHFLL